MPLYHQKYPHTPFGRYLKKRQDEMGLSTRKLAARLGWHESKVSALKTRVNFHTRLQPYDFYLLGELLHESPVALQLLYLQDREYASDLDWHDGRIPALEYQMVCDLLQVFSPQQRQSILKYMMFEFVDSPEASKIAYQQMKGKRQEMSHPALKTPVAPALNGKHAPTTAVVEEEKAGEEEEVWTDLTNS